MRVYCPDCKSEPCAHIERLYVEALAEKARLRNVMQKIVDDHDRDEIAYLSSPEFCGGDPPDETIEALRSALRQGDPK